MDYCPYEAEVASGDYCIDVDDALRAIDGDGDDE